MSADFDRFLAGEGALADLIRRQPAFDAPEGLFDRVMTALDCAAPNLQFEPPAALEAAVLAEAARLDAAQQPRREALLDEIAAGTSAQAAMGIGLSEATDRWLAQAAQTRPTPAPVAKRARRRGWWQGLGVAVTAALAASVALQLWFDPMASSPTMRGAELDAATGRAQSTPPPAAIDGDDAAGPRHDMPERWSAPAAEMAMPAPAPKPAPRREMKRTAPETMRAPGVPPAAPPARAVAPSLGVEPQALSEEAVADLAASTAAESASGLDKARQRAGAALERLAKPSQPASELTAPVTIAAETLAERLAAHAPGQWTLIAAPVDAPQASALTQALDQRFQALGRPDRISTTLDPAQPDGEVRLVFRPLSPDAPRSPSSPPPPPSANDR
jgi:hypothetical protein